MTPKYYRPLADISPAAATNDLRAAVAARLLRAEGMGRSRRYVAGGDLSSSIARGLDLGERRGLTPEQGRDLIVGELSRRASLEPSPVPITDE